MKENTEFKVGDVVCFTCGGPAMTITAIAEDGSVDAMQWIEEAHSYMKHEGYDPACFTKELFA